MSFRPLLASLVERAEGARGAVFCDHEGEFVDLVIKDPPPPGCGGLTHYEMRVFGAHLAATWLALEAQAAETGAGRIVELKLGCQGGTLLLRGLRDGYYLLLLCAPGTQPGRAAVALAETAREVAAEI